jgi:hypothetical protein
VKDLTTTTTNATSRRERAGGFLPVGEVRRGRGINAGKSLEAIALPRRSLLQREKAVAAS